MIELLHTLAAGDPVGHVIDHPMLGDGSEVWHWFISNTTIMLFITAGITYWIISSAAKKIATGGDRSSVEDFRAQGAGANFVEAVCLYLREEVFRPIFHEQTDKYLPILWTFFWFILVGNILGLVPLVDLTHGLYTIGVYFVTGEAQDVKAWHGFGGTATQSIYVTGALAFIAFLVINVTGLMKDPKGYFAHLTGGIPFSIPMLPIIAIIVLVEAIGIFVKPFALALRLFANMSGGHILLAVLIGFVPQLIQKGGGNVVVAPIPLLGAAAIMLLEILVAFLQAFIFTFLTGLFLGQLVHHDHEHEHQPEDYEEKPGLDHGPMV